jgi:hypothetical protein
MNFSTMIKKPSAFLPVAMSFVVLATLFIYFVRFGVVHEADEGTAAHIFQILMAGQVPIVAFFAITWLPRFPRQALQVLALQAGAALAACAPVFIFKL